MRRTLCAVLALLLAACAAPLEPTSQYAELSALKPGKGKKPPPSTSGVLSLSRGDWETLSVGNVPLSNPSSGGLQFAFPNAPNSINYLYSTRASRTIADSLSVSFTIATTGVPVFSAEPWDTGAPKLMLYFQVNNDWSSDNGRWWFQTPIILAEGAWSLTAPLDWQQWSNVYGQRDPTAFAAALRNVSDLGVTFGGQSFAGHGVNLTSGGATFTLTEYRVQP